MRAKIRKTGEIVEVYHEPQHGQITNVYKESVLVNGRMWTEDELELLSNNDEHWQDVRERAAIAAMQGIVSCGEGAFSYQEITDEIAKAAVDYANSLIEELKKK